MLSRLPLVLAHLLAWSLAWIWWFFIPVRKSVALENLSRAFPEKSSRDKARLARRSLAEMALGYVELLHMLRSPERHRNMVNIEGMEHLHECRRSGQGCLVVCGHGGSWDLCLVAFGQKPDFKVTCVVRPPSQPWVAGFMERARETMGVELLPPSGCKETIYDRIRQGNIVMFPMDQSVREGILVPFFGTPARTAASVAAFGRRTGVPVVFGWQWRIGIGKHRAMFQEPYALEYSEDRQADLERATAIFTESIEQAIRRNPHGWLWMHRRWK